MLEIFKPAHLKQREKEVKLLDREYHLTKLYVGMVKGAYDFMDEKQKQAWLELNGPDKMDGCISLFYGSTDWMKDE